MGKWSSLEGRGSIPEFLPISWADWESDEHVQDMDDAMEGVYFKIVRELWKYDEFTFNHNRLAERIHSDRRNVKKFFDRWGHLFRCCNCGGVPQPSYDCAPTVSLSCSECAPTVLLPCSEHAPSVLLPCSCGASRVYHQKLRNYRNNATSGSRLGTIEEKQTKQNEIQLKKSKAAPLLGSSASSSFADVTETPTHGTGGRPISSEAASAPVTPPPGSAAPPSPAKTMQGAFDPLNYVDEVTATKGDRRIYDPDDVHRTLFYHFAHRKDKFWAERVTSAKTLANNIDTMYQQMVKAVGADWEPSRPVAKAKQSMSKQMEWFLSRSKQ